jgi:hypothetical protein
MRGCAFLNVFEPRLPYLLVAGRPMWGTWLLTLIGTTRRTPHDNRARLGDCGCELATGSSTTPLRLVCARRSPVVIVGTTENCNLNPGPPTAVSGWVRTTDGRHRQPGSVLWGAVAGVSHGGVTTSLHQLPEHANVTTLTTEAMRQRPRPHPRDPPRRSAHTQSKSAPDHFGRESMDASGSQPAAPRTGVCWGLLCFCRVLAFRTIDSGLLMSVWAGPSVMPTARPCDCEHRVGLARGRKALARGTGGVARGLRQAAAHPGSPLPPCLGVSECVWALCVRSLAWCAGVKGCWATRCGCRLHSRCVTRRPPPLGAACSPHGVRVPLCLTTTSVAVGVGGAGPAVDGDGPAGSTAAHVGSPATDPAPVTPATVAKPRRRSGAASKATGGATPAGAPGAGVEEAGGVDPYTPAVVPEDQREAVVKAYEGACACTRAGGGGAAFVAGLRARAPARPRTGCASSGKVEAGVRRVCGCTAR